jgi:hypothetical protein
VFVAVDTGAGLKLAQGAFSYGFFFRRSFWRKDDGVDEIDRPDIVVMVSMVEFTASVDETWRFLMPCLLFLVIVPCGVRASSCL